MTSNPYLIVRRVMEGGRLWGVKLYYNNQYWKMSKERLAEVIQKKIKTVLLDMKGKEDKPVELIMYNNSFRSIRDGHLCNNFNKLRSIKLVSANKLKVRR